MDLSIITDNWPYDEEEEANNVRKVAGIDGRMKSQVGIPGGVIQWELDGRPDGSTPYGCASVLEYCERSGIEPYPAQESAFEALAEDRHEPRATRLAALESLAELGAAGARVLPSLQIPEREKRLSAARESALRTARANALYDKACDEYHAGRPERALALLDAIEDPVSGGRDVHRLGRILHEALAEREAEGGRPRSRPSSGPAVLRETPAPCNRSTAKGEGP